MTLLGVAFLLEGLLVFCTSFNVRLGCLVYLTFLQTFDTLRFVSVFGFQGTKCGLFVRTEERKRSSREPRLSVTEFLSVIRKQKFFYPLITGKYQFFYIIILSDVFFIESGSHLLSHAVSSIVPSAA